MGRKAVETQPAVVAEAVGAAEGGIAPRPGADAPLDGLRLIRLVILLPFRTLLDERLVVANVDDGGAKRAVGGGLAHVHVLQPAAPFTDGNVDRIAGEQVLVELAREQVGRPVLDVVLHREHRGHAGPTMFSATE